MREPYDFELLFYKGNEALIYLNGNFLTEDATLIPVSDRGLLLGDGLFETLLAVKGRALFLERHWQRMQEGLRLLNISPPLTYENLKTITAELLAKNQLLSSTASLRITITRGSAVRGLLPPENACPNYFITAAPYSPPSITPFKAIFSSIRRNEYSPLTQIKSLNYLDNILARLEAKNSDAHDALFLNTQGMVTDSTVANIFVVINQRIITPPVTDGLIPGIIRAQVIDICSQLDIPYQEVSISPETLLAADEVFLTNSLMGIQPISSIDSHLYSLEPQLSSKINHQYQAFQRE